MLMYAIDMRDHCKVNKMKGSFLLSVIVLLMSFWGCGINDKEAEMIDFEQWRLKTLQLKDSLVSVQKDSKDNGISMVIYFSNRMIDSAYRRLLFENKLASSYIEGADSFIVAELASNLTYYSAYIYKMGSDSMVSMKLSAQGDIKVEKEEYSYFNVPGSDLEIVFSEAENPSFGMSTLFVRSKAGKSSPINSFYNVKVGYR